MSKQYTKTTPVKFSHIGHTKSSLFEPFLPVTSVFFNTEYGLLIYYDDQKKWSKQPQHDFHIQIEGSAAGLNTGWYEGLTVEKRKKNDDLYLEYNPKCRLLTEEEITPFANKYQ